MNYRHDISECLQSQIRKHQTLQSDLDALFVSIDPVIKTFASYHREKSLPLFSITEERQDLEDIQRIADHIRTHFKHVVILGIGGSSLNGQAITGLHFPSWQDEIHLHFLDNLDPFSIESLFEQLPADKTAFISISKSGGTVETLTQTLLATQWLEEKLTDTDQIAQHCFFITEPKSSPLRNLAENLGSEILDHHTGIGGRFSGFTNVGLLPAAILGLDIEAFRRGGAQVIKQHVTTSDPSKLPAAAGAALSMALMQRGYTNTVIMPYIDRLSPFATWFLQVWAESLGKNGHGTTPIKAVGTMDQHSQLQLYLDGPQDKMFTFFALDTANQGPRIDTSRLEQKDLSYLNGHHVGDVIEAEYRATAETLIAKNCPVRRFELATLDMETLGALMMHVTLETMIMADLMAINAFDQPAVEEGKRKTVAFLTKKAA